MAATFINVNFSEANLQNADFSNTALMQDQLQSALSTRDARLPNGSLFRNSNLIGNGYAQCNLSVSSQWKMRTGNITIGASKDQINECHFVLQSYDIGAIMWQRISLANSPKSYFDFHLKGVLNARMSLGVSMRLSAIEETENVVSEKNLSKWTLFSGISLISASACRLVQ